ncbi:MAG TPA: flippase-like domain-containing protein [Tepidisphaeraceae bacterium]|jgi:putative membrane protein
MKAPRKIKLTFWLFGLGGAAIFTALLIHQGASQVVAAVATAGWGLAAMVAYHLCAPIFLDAIAWGLLFPSRHRLPLRKLFLMRWISEAVSALVPSAAVGGDIVRARLATLDGVPRAVSAATVLVDMTLNLLAGAGYTLLGMVLLVGASGQTRFVGPTLLATAIGLGACALFYFAQRLGMFRFIAVIVTRLARAPEWQSLVASGENLDRTIQTLYGRRLAVVASAGASILAFVGGAGEVWIAMRALGLNALFLHALILHSMALAVRSAAFVVPAGLGVQEGGYLFVGSLLGIPGEAAFALALMARARELTLGVPGLIAWQFIESRLQWRTRAERAAQ